MSRWEKDENPRLRAIFEAFHEGKFSTAADIIEAADLIQVVPETIPQSLKDIFNDRYRSHLNWIVASVRELNEGVSTSEDPDFLLLLARHEKFRWVEGMEVNLKLVRSKRGEESFRSCSTYKNVRGGMIVLRIGDKPSQNEFVHRFKKELARVGNIYCQFDKP